MAALTWPMLVAARPCGTVEADSALPVSGPQESSSGYHPSLSAPAGSTIMIFIRPILRERKTLARKRSEQDRLVAVALVALVAVLPLSGRASEDPAMTPLLIDDFQREETAPVSAHGGKASPGRTWSAHHYARTVCAATQRATKRNGRTHHYARVACS